MDSTRWWCSPYVGYLPVVSRCFHGGVPGAAIRPRLDPFDCVPELYRAADIIVGCWGKKKRLKVTHRTLDTFLQLECNALITRNFINFILFYQNRVKLFHMMHIVKYEIRKLRLRFKEVRKNIFASRIASNFRSYYTRFTSITMYVYCLDVC